MVGRDATTPTPETEVFGVTYGGSESDSEFGFDLAGGDLVTGAEVLGLRREGTGWRIETRAGDFTTRVLVNCAGLPRPGIGFIIRCSTSCTFGEWGLGLTVYFSPGR